MVCAKVDVHRYADMHVCMPKSSMDALDKVWLQCAVTCIYAWVLVPLASCFNEQTTAAWSVAPSSWLVPGISSTSSSVVAAALVV